MERITQLATKGTHEIANKGMQGGKNEGKRRRGNAGGYDGLKVHVSNSSGRR